MQQCVKPEQALTICPSLDGLVNDIRQFSSHSSSSPRNLEAVDAAYDSLCGPLVSVTRVYLASPVSQCDIILLSDARSEVEDLRKKSGIVRVDRDTWIDGKNDNVFPTTDSNSGVVHAIANNFSML